MKKFKINNRIITADSVSKAVKISKMLDSAKSVKTKDGMTHENWSFIDRHSPDFQTTSEAQKLIDYMRQKGLKTYYLTASDETEEKLLENAIRNIKRVEQSAGISTLTAIYTPDHDKFTKGYTIELRDSIKTKDKLVDVPPAAIGAVKSKLKSFGLDVVKEGKTWSGREHLEFAIDKSLASVQDVVKIVEQVEAEVEKKFNCPMTFNIGQNSSSVVAVIDIDKQYVKDSVKDAFNIVKGSIFKERQGDSRTRWYIKVLDVDDDIVSFQAISPNRTYGEVDKMPIERFKRILESRYAQANSIYDADYSYLTEEEQKAVDDYKQAISTTTNPEVLKIFQHILEEELEHINELKQAESMDDSVNDANDYTVNISYYNLGLRDWVKGRRFATFEEADRYVVSEMKRIYNEGYSINTAFILYKKKDIKRMYIDDGSGKHYKIDSRY